MNVKPYYGTDANAIATREAHTASLTMDQPVDIINATIDELIAQDIELPASSTLDRLTEQIHARAQSRLFKRVKRRLTTRARPAAARGLSSRQTAYKRIKRHARRPSRKHLDLLVDQIAWLDEIGDFSLAVAGIPASKLRSLANQAMALDASALRNDTLPEKRYTLIVALLNLGHSNPRVVAAMAEQAHRVTFAYPRFFESEQNVRLAGKVTELAGDGFDRAFFVSGGSEANEAALKLARQYAVACGQSTRWKVISRDPSYHGSTMGAMAVTATRSRSRSTAQCSSRCRRFLRR